MKSARRKLFVDSEFQAALARRVAIHWFLLIFCGLLATCALASMANPSDGLWEHVRTAWLHTGGFLLVMLCLVPIFVYDTIRLSHRVAGPMCRFRKALQAAARGESVAPFAFRKGDYWQSLADDLNNVIKVAEAERRKSEALSSGVGSQQMEMSSRDS